ncbi:MAG: ZIP family metal transporter [Saprospiraceae bacterium]|nr:ZIP family metal transporter [Saprospiraceae bacterium]
MHIWEYILLFGSVFLGGSSGFLFPKENKGFLQIVLSFSGAYILGIAVLHLMPWVFGSGDSKAGLFVLLGFFVQLLLEQLSAGVEHGHIHAPHKLSTGFVLSVMLGLCVHAFVEGIPLSYYGEMHEVHHGTHTHNHLLYGIVMHHIPAAFALVFLMIISKLQRVWIWVCLFVFSAMSPLGAMLAGMFDLSEGVQVRIIGFVIGSLLHIATVILFEMDNSSHHYISWRKLIAISAGLGFAILTIL